MKTKIFGGTSDDTFGEITPTGTDYDNCANGKPIEFLIESESEGKGLLVVGHHAPGSAGGWLVGVAPWDPDYSDAPMPDWPMRLRAPTGHEPVYSPVLEIDVPDDATLRCLQHIEGDD